VEIEGKEERKKMVKKRTQQNNDSHMERPKERKKSEKWVKNKTIDKDRKFAVLLGRDTV